MMLAMRSATFYTCGQSGFSRGGCNATHLTAQSLHGMILEHDRESPVDGVFHLLSTFQVVGWIIPELLLLLVGDYSQSA